MMTSGDSKLSRRFGATTAVFASLMIAGCGSPADEREAIPAAGEIVATVAPVTTAPPLDEEGPVSVTGVRIGDAVDPSGTVPGLQPDGRVDLSVAPTWIAVSSDGVVVGYVLGSDLFQGPSDPSEPPRTPQIFDETGQVRIGELLTDGPSLDAPGPTLPLSADE